MLLKYYGHSFFTLALESGAVIALIPTARFMNTPAARCGPTCA